MSEIDSKLDELKNQIIQELNVHKDNCISMMKNTTEGFDIMRLDNAITQIENLQSKVNRLI